MQTNNTTENVSSTVVRSEPAILEESVFQNRRDWYIQQIYLAEQSEKLAGINAKIAEHRFQENYSWAKLAQLTTAPPSETEEKIPAEEIKTTA